MSVITISRGTYSKGKDIAERLAKRLGYECISREVIIEASKEFNIPEIKLRRALHDAPSVLDRFTYGKERYIAYIKLALLEWARKDNVVYHGLAGHFFLQGIPHVLKTRIIANIEDRIKEEVEKGGITEEEARKLIEKDDYERRKWALALYGIDTADCKLYDMVFHLDTLTPDDVVDLLEDAVKRPCFQPTEDSIKILEDRYLVAKIEASLIGKFPSVKVTFQDGTAYISLKCHPRTKNTLRNQIKEILSDYEEIKNIDLEILPHPLESVPD